MSIEESFSDIDGTRARLIGKKQLDALPGYVERGIHSSELNSIIQKAKTFTPSESLSL